MDFDVAAFLDAFFEEAEEHVQAFEHGLLELERNPSDREVIGSVFRAAHSIKGASGTFGLTGVMQFTHELEGVLDLLRKDSLAYDAELAALLLAALDVLKELLASSRAGTPPPAREAELRARLEALRAGPVAGVVAPIDAAPGPKRPRSVVVRVEPLPELFARGMDPIVLLRELYEMGVGGAQVEIDDSDLPPLEELDPELCYLRFRVSMETAASEADIREVFTFVEGLCDVKVESEGPAQTPERAPGAETAEKAAAPGERTAAAGAANATVRVSADKLDKLLDLVGELVIAQAMIVESLRSPGADHALRLQDALSAMERNTRDLQESVMSIRMVPLASVFGRLPRIVRDVSAKCGKQVRVEIEGEETEIDKAMVELLVDPLTHLVRNAVDHGLEAPDERQLAGKSQEGLVTVRAFHQGGAVVVEVGDDGRGLATELIRDKALRQGLIGDDATLSDEQIHELIFHPGFSTAASVSDVSGRGVGMDVVKRNIETIKGSLAVSTERGAGTRVRLRLPLTLAILDGFAVRIADQTFILPLLSVVESFRPTRAQVRSIVGRHDVIDVRGVSTPIVHLYRVLGVPSAITDPCEALVCIVESGGARVAVLVDEVLGQMQVVVKSLETNYQRLDLLMGATILGNGRVAMILDVQALSKVAHGTAQSLMTRGSARQEDLWLS